MDADLNWLDDELSALNEAEGAMGQISFESAFPVIRDNDNTTESGNGKVTHSTALPKRQSSVSHVRSSKKRTKKPIKPVEESPIIELTKDPIVPETKPDKPFPALNLGLDDTNLPTSETDMSRYVSEPLGNGEDELEFYTKSLIDKMNSPGDKDMYGYCGKCNGIVEGEKTGCKALEKIFHIDCFRCKTCEDLLHGSQFYVVEKDIFCESCYMNSLEKCTVCSENITERILRATGKPYHPACFKCVVCSKMLDGVPFTVDVTNQIHCVDCFHKKFAPKCSVCNEPIMPEDELGEAVRIVALDRSFHVNCYRCEKCGMNLSDKENGCYPLDGRILCRDCNTAMVQELSQNIK